MAENTTTRVVEIEVDNAKAIKEMAELNMLIEESVQKEKELKNAIKEKGEASDEDRQQLVKLKAEQTTYKRELQAISKEVQNNIKIQRENEGSLASLRAQLSNVTKEYDNLSRAEREGAKGQELKNKINEITDELKGAEEETQRFYRNVGNYAGSLNDILAQHIPMLEKVKSAVSPIGALFKDIKAEVKSTGTAFVESAKATTGMSTAQKAATITSAALSAGLKILKIALISTGIGAIIVALGSLIAYFTKTQKGIEAVSRVTAALGAAFNVIIDRIAKFGGAIIKLFSGDFKGAASDMKAAFSGIGEEIKNDATQAAKLKQQLIELDKADASLTARRASEKVRIAELKRISDDTTKSTKERIAAANEALEIEQRTAQELAANGEKRIANMLGYTEVTEEVKKQIDLIKRGAADADTVIANLGLSKSALKDYQALTEAIASYQQGVEEFTNMTVEGTTKVNTIRQEAAEKQKAAREAEIAATQAAIDAEIALMTDGAAKDLATENERHKRKVDALKKRLETEKTLTKAARVAINRQIELEDKQHEQNVAKLKSAADLERIAKEQEIINLRLAAVKQGTDAEYTLKVEQLQKQQEAELANVELTEQQKVLIREKYNKQMDDLSNQWINANLQKQNDALRLEWENRINEAAVQGQNTLQLQLQMRQAELDALQQMEGESDAAFKARQLAAQQAYVDAKRAINDYEVQIEQAKLEALEAVTNGLSGLLEELGEDNKTFAVLSKTLALAEIAINTGKAIAAGTAQAQSVPFPGNLIAIATTVATIMANITSAIKTVKSAKFSTGGYVSGPGTSTSDSIPAMLSDGESVNAALPTSMFAPIYSALNQLGGGAPIVAAQSSNQIAGEDMLARAFAKGVSQLDMRVGVDEITRVSDRVKVVESLGDL